MGGPHSAGLVGRAQGFLSPEPSSARRISVFTSGVKVSLTGNLPGCTLEGEMEIRFKEASLKRLYFDPGFVSNYPSSVIKAFRKRVQLIVAAQDERAFYALKSLHFERLKGKRDHQYSMRLNQQWRLVVEFEGRAPDKIVVVISIEDYH